MSESRQDRSRREARESTIDEFAAFAHRKRWGGRVKVVKNAVIQVAVEASNDEVADLRTWLADHEVVGIGEVRFADGKGVPLPDPLVRLIQAVTE